MNAEYRFEASSGSYTFSEIIFAVQLGQYYGCWYPSSLCRQIINTRGTDYVSLSVIAFYGDGFKLFVLSRCGEMENN